MKNLFKINNAIKNAHTISKPKPITPVNTPSTFTKKPPIGLGNMATANPTIPFKPQYHPLGSSSIPGAEFKSTTGVKPPMFNKTAGVKDFATKVITESVQPLNVGLSTMSIASGESSLGGEIGGQLTSSVSQTAAKPILRRIYEKGITPETNVRKLGKGGLGLLTSISGYIAGNYAGNRWIPLLKRKNPDTYKPSASEIKAMKNLYNRGYEDATLKTAADIPITSGGEATVVAAQEAPSIRQRINNFANKQFNKLPVDIREAITPYKKAVPYILATGGALMLGNQLYSDRQSQAKKRYYTSIVGNTENSIYKQAGVWDTMGRFFRGNNQSASKKALAEINKKKVKVTKAKQNKIDIANSSMGSILGSVAKDRWGKAVNTAKSWIPFMNSKPAKKVTTQKKTKKKTTAEQPKPVEQPKPAPATVQVQAPKPTPAQPKPTPVGPIMILPRTSQPVATTSQPVANKGITGADALKYGVAGIAGAGLLGAGVALGKGRQVNNTPQPQPMMMPQMPYGGGMYPGMGMGAGMSPLNPLIINNS